MKSSVPRRGLRDICTMSERTSDADNPQRKYLTLAMLELEKLRRNKERLAASDRVADIDQRLADITAEQTRLLAAAGEELEPDAPGKGHGRAAGSDSQPGGGFKLAY